MEPYGRLISDETKVFMEGLRDEDIEEVADCDGMRSAVEEFALLTEPWRFGPDLFPALPDRHWLNWRRGGGADGFDDTLQLAIELSQRRRLAVVTAEYEVTDVFSDWDAWEGALDKATSATARDFATRLAEAVRFHFAADVTAVQHQLPGREEAR